jgi:tetratricopeptide (TPR) repeat protein
LLKRLGRYEDAIDAYDGILQIWPGYEAARNGKAAILVIRGRYDEAISLLPSGKPLTANDWVGWHIRGMVMLRKNALDDAVEFLEEAHKTIPFAREKRYFDGALGIARLRQSKFEQAALALVDSAGGLSNVLRFHAHAGMGNVARAQTLYGELKNRCPAQIIDIRDAIAGRFGLAPAVAAHNDNWIFGREMEAMLQEAA